MRAYGESKSGQERDAVSVECCQKGMDTKKTIVGWNENGDDVGSRLKI